MTPAFHPAPKHPSARGGRYRWVATAVLLASVFLLYETVGESGYLARREQQQKIQALSQQVEDLQRENERIGQNIHNLRSDPAAIEEMAREQLHLARPGELVITLPSNPIP
jgi:cell division protein FtsB